MLLLRGYLKVELFILLRHWTRVAGKYDHDSCGHGVEVTHNEGDPSHSRGHRPLEQSDEVAHDHN
jgi:hypothetical protein